MANPKKEDVNEYDTLSYDQQYEYLCEQSGMKQCKRCGSWEHTLSDGICDACEHELDQQRRK